VRTPTFLPSDVRCLDVAKVAAVFAGLSLRAADCGLKVEGLQISPLGGIAGPIVQIVLVGPSA